jgi:hypothetical protein
VKGRNVAASAGVDDGDAPAEAAVGETDDDGCGAVVVRVGVDVAAAAGVRATVAVPAAVVAWVVADVGRGFVAGGREE